MNIYSLKRKQLINTSLDNAWKFFSSPENLKKITPDYMGFDIISEIDSEKVYPGMIIIYTVSPVLGIPLKWVTEITHIDPPFYFVDEQRFGPYGFWHHKHYFREIDAGVEMSDLVHYSIPYSFIGKIAHSLIVKRKLEEIFDFRYQKIEEMFKK